MFRRDYLMRQIEQLRALFARMMQLKHEQKYDDAFQEAQTALDELFGTQGPLIRYADSATLAALVGEPELVRGIARISAAEAELFEARGDTAMAEQKRRRALELYVEAGAGREAAELRARVDVAALGERYRGP